VRGKKRPSLVRTPGDYTKANLEQVLTPGEAYKAYLTRSNLDKTSNFQINQSSTDTSAWKYNMYIAIFKCIYLFKNMHLAPNTY
jgi:hypothetical protein